VHGDKATPRLPIVDICEDQIVLPVAGIASPLPKEQAEPWSPAWQRWNDYGIGCLLEGGAGAKRGNLRQAEVAFTKLLTLGQKDATPQGHVNLARVYFEQGRLAEAAAALNAARACDPPAAWWTLAWFNGLVTAENATGAADLDAAIGFFESIVDPANQVRERNFDFTRDPIVLNRLGLTLFKRSQLEADNPAAQRQFLLRAVSAYERAFAVDQEDLDTHYGLSQCYTRLGESQPAGDVYEGKENSVQQLLESAAVVTNSKETADRRIRETERLGEQLTALGRQPPDPANSRLPVLRELRGLLQTAFHAESDAKVQAAIASVLGHLHRELHTLYKPDDSARARATEIYRHGHPAANAAAEAIVIYPLRRPEVGK
jgi:tetratricopeptide (TPR) repeat protein